MKTIKVPISIELTSNLIILCGINTVIGLQEFYTKGEKYFNQSQSIVFILFGLPTIILVWFWLDKRIEFKDNKKVRKADRLLKLPFSKFLAFLILYVSWLFMVAGLSMIFRDNDIDRGLPTLLIGVFVISFIIIAFEYPKIWFSNTSNIEDRMEEIANIPKEELPAYQDGFFSYSENYFTIKLDNEVKTINWSDINLIQVYKMDLYTVDCIMIEIYLTETYITINEEIKGYMKFMETASTKLDNFKKDWFSAVAFPAFETNLTIVYQRQTED